MEKVNIEVLERNYYLLKAYHQKMVNEIEILEKRRADAIEAVYINEFSKLKALMDKREGKAYPYGGVAPENASLFGYLLSALKTTVFMQERFETLAAREDHAKNQVWDYLMKKNAYNVKLQTGIQKRYSVRDKVTVRLSQIGKILGKDAMPAQKAPEDVPAVETEIVPENMPKVETY